MKKTTTEYIIGKTIKDFKIEDASWVNDAVDWVGDAIEAIGYHCGLINKIVHVYVKHHMVSFPCDLVALKFIEYKGARLPLGTDVTGVIMEREVGKSVLPLTEDSFQSLRTLWAKLDQINEIEDPTAEDLLEKEDVLREISALTIGRKISSTDMNHCVLPYYNINENFIQTSFTGEEIGIIYRAFQLDEKGFPMIIDTYKYREAVKWFLFRNLFIQGYKHPVITFPYADTKWEEFRFKASNEQKMPSADMLERFHNRWHSIKRGVDLGSSFVINAEQPQGSIF